MKRVIFGGIAVAAIAGIAYLATLGCCHVLGIAPRPKSMTQGLNLNTAQREEVAALEREYLARKRASCGTLCAKRAQIIQLLRQEMPDPAALNGLVEEIGREQVALEKTTLDHLLAVSRTLEPAQRERLVASVIEELRLGCKKTACGAAGRCFVAEAEKR